MLAAVLTITPLAACSLTPSASISAPSTAPTATAVSSPVDAVVDSPGAAPLRLRSEPSTEGAVLTSVKKGTHVAPQCQVFGERIRGTQGTTTIWVRVTVGKKTGYLSAAYLKGGTDSRIPPCPAASPTPSPSATTTP